MQLKNKISNELRYKKLLLVAFITLLFCSCNLKRNYTVFEFNSLSFDSSSISLGDSSHVIISGLKKNNLEISYNPADTSFEWKTNTPTYFKINNKNPNAYKLDSIKTIVIENVPISKNDFEKAIDSITPTTIWNWVGITHTQNLFPLKQFFSAAKNQNISEGVHSFYSNDSTTFVLLDTIVKLVKLDGTIISYKSSDRIPGNSFNIQFYKAIVKNSVPADSSTPSLRLKDTAFFINTYSSYTNFGASNFNISANRIDTNITLKVAFDVPYRIIFSPESLEQQLLKNDNLPVNIVQEHQASSFTINLLVPNFSFYYTQRLGVLNPDNTITKKFIINSNRTPEFLISSIPLLFVYFSVILLLWILKGTKTFFNDNLYTLSGHESEANAWRFYIIVLFTVLFLLLFYREYIGFQLSYTAPYFSFIFPNQALIAPLIYISTFGFVSMTFACFSVNNSKKLQAVLISGIGTTLLACVTIALFIYFNDPFVDIILKELKEFHWFRGGSLKTKAGVLYIFVYLFLCYYIFFFLLILYFRISQSAFITQLQSIYVRIKAYRHSSIISALFLTVVYFGGAFMISNAYSAITLIFLLVTQYLVFSGIWVLPFSNKISTVIVKIITGVCALVLSYFLFYYLHLISATVLLIVLTSGLLLLHKKYGSLFWERIFTFTPRHRDIWLTSFLLLLPILGVVLYSNDIGYIINLPLILITIPLIFHFHYEQLQDNYPEDYEDETKVRLKYYFPGKMILAFLLVVLFFYYKASSYTGSLDDFKSRTLTRLTTFNSFSEVERAGFTNSEKVSQFFAVLSKYTSKQHNQEAFHSSISNFSDPVVINDLSFPVGSIANNGLFSSLILILLIMLLIFFVWKITFISNSDYDDVTSSNLHIHDKRNWSMLVNKLTSFGVIRLLASVYLLSNVLWLVLSYYSIVPFTGRLIIGLGQDSVGEILETTILFTALGFITQKNSDL